MQGNAACFRAHRQCLCQLCQKTIASRPGQLFPKRVEESLSIAGVVFFAKLLQHSIKNRMSPLTLKQTLGCRRIKAYTGS